MVYRLGLWMHDRRWWVVALWLALAGLLHWLAPAWSSVTMDGDLEQLPPTTTTVRATQLRARAFPEDRAASQIVLVVARTRNDLTVEDHSMRFGWPSKRNKFLLIHWSTCGRKRPRWWGLCCEAAQAVPRGSC